MAAPGPYPPVAPPASVPAGERVYAIGDIHGRLDLLAALVARIRADNAARAPARVRLILLGDLIDRGPHSAAIVAAAQALAARSPNLVVLKGNHEVLMLEALAGRLDALAVWLRNGGDATLASWGVDEALIAEGPSRACLLAAQRQVPADVRAWLTRLPVSCRIGDYLFVHAGIRPGVPLDRQRHEDMLWIRHEFLDSEVDHACVVVHGHTVVPAAELRANRIGLDTGAYHSGVLTALALEGDTRQVIATTPDEAAHPTGLAADVEAILGCEQAPDDAPASRSAATMLGAAIALAARLTGRGKGPR